MASARMRMRRSAPFRLGFSGYLELEGALDSRRHIDLGEHDPARLRQSLRITALAQEVFPNVITGVRFWPFLLVARDLEGNGTRRSGNNRVLSALRRIAAAQRKHPKVTLRTRIGPRSLASFRPYQGMFRAICDSSRNGGRTRGLVRFLLDRRRQYRGNLDFFDHHESRWKRALKSSMGAPGKCFATVINDEKVKKVEDAIQEILRKPGEYHPKLVEAAAAYALLVCLYGVVEEGEVYSAESAKTYARLLLKLIERKPSLPVAGYAQWIRQAARSPEPPLGGVTKKAWEQRRRILSGLRFGTFWNLYRRPSPRVLD